MHPMHALSARDQMQQHQQMQQLTAASQQDQQQDQQQQQSTMTVLDSMNPVQQQQQQQMNNEQQAQVMGMIDPVQRQQQQQQHVVQQQQHLVQQQQQPHLHQLQPSQQTIEQSLNVNEHQHSIEQQQQQQQRPPIISGEGIVADSGGPIVQWLLENYEISEGESLPRSTVYNHYLAHCRQLQMASVNAASFGKLIRSVFVGLKTRRLGTRGHSKYHYFGVRAKQHVQHELMQHHEGGSSAGCSRVDQNDNSNHRTEDGSESDTNSVGRLSQQAGGASPSKRIKRSSSVYNKHHQVGGGLVVEQQQQQQQHTIELASNGLYYATNNGASAVIISGANCQPTNGYAKIHHNGNQQHQQQQQQQSPTLDSCEIQDSRNHLGANWATLVDEHWPQREIGQLEQQLIKSGGTNEWSVGYLAAFETEYKSYYKRMVELLSELKFLEVEQLWQQFWRPPPASASTPTTPNNSNNINSQQQPDEWPRTMEVASGEQNGHQPEFNHEQQQQQQQHQQVELDYHCLYQLTSQPLIVDRINQIDYSLFAAIESFLFPDMLSPIPGFLRQQIEMFAINIGPCLEVAVKDYEPQFVAEKSKSARAFGYALRRYAELNRLSTASRAIWEKRSSLAQLSMDLSRLDLRYIEHQVSLMTNHKSRPTTDQHNLISSGRLKQDSTLPADKTNDTTRPSDENDETACNTINSNNTNNSAPTEPIITNNENSPLDENNGHHHHNHNHHRHLCAMQPGQLIQNFLHLLEDPYPANSWPDWCRNLFESRVCGLSMEEARNFVLDEWKNYISRIEKELTLRSAPSLSSFHLIKLLFGEYIDYLVDTRLVQRQQHKAHHQHHLPTS